jgi:hypothetical protein
VVPTSVGARPYPGRNGVTTWNPDLTSGSTRVVQKQSVEVPWMTGIVGPEPCDVYSMVPFFV